MSGHGPPGLVRRQGRHRPRSPTSRWRDRRSTIVEPDQREAALAQRRRLARGEDRRQPDQGAALGLRASAAAEGRPRPRRRTAASARSSTVVGAPPTRQTSPTSRHSVSPGRRSRTIRRNSPGGQDAAAPPQATPPAWPSPRHIGSSAQRHSGQVAASARSASEPVKLSAGSSRPPAADVLGLVRVGDDVAVGALARLGAVARGWAPAASAAACSHEDPATAVPRAAAPRRRRRSAGGSGAADPPRGHAPESAATDGSAVLPQASRYRLPEG